MVPSLIALERARLHVHLLRAEAWLRLQGRPPAVIDALARYRRAGEFPRHRGRGLRPVFHDPAGPRCAVAALLHGTNAGAVADQIARTENEARVLDMRTDLAPWAREHGLTIDDLRRIQPAYTGDETSTGIATLVGLMLLGAAAIGLCGHAVDRWFRQRPWFEWWVTGVLLLPVPLVGVAFLPDRIPHGAVSGACLTVLAAFALAAWALTLVGLLLRRALGAWRWVRGRR